MTKKTAFTVPINQLVYRYNGKLYYCTVFSFAYDAERLPSGVEGRCAYGIVGDVANDTPCFNRAEMVRLYKERPEGFVIFNDELYRAIIAIESRVDELVVELMEFTKMKLDLLEIVPAPTKEIATKKMEAQEELQSIIRHAKGLLNAKRSK